MAVTLDGAAQLLNGLVGKGTGIVYDDAVDVVPCRYTYEVTDEPIEPIED